MVKIVISFSDIMDDLLEEHPELSRVVVPKWVNLFKTFLFCCDSNFQLLDAAAFQRNFYECIYNRMCDPDATYTPDDPWATEAMQRQLQCQVWDYAGEVLSTIVMVFTRATNAMRDAGLTTTNVNWQFNDLLFTCDEVKNGH